MIYITAKSSFGEFSEIIVAHQLRFRANTKQAYLLLRFLVAFEQRDMPVAPIALLLHAELVLYIFQNRVFRFVCVEVGSSIQACGHIGFIDFINA